MKWLEILLKKYFTCNLVHYFDVDGIFLTCLDELFLIFHKLKKKHVCTTPKTGSFLDLHLSLEADVCGIISRVSFSN